MVVNLGILAVQGNFHQHKNILKGLGTNIIYVKYPEELNKCDGLIIPGGESTTMSIQLDRNALREPLIKFSSKKSISNSLKGSEKPRLIIMNQEKRWNIFFLINKYIY